MNKYILIGVMSIISYASCAHAPNEAFFELFESEGKLLIKAEFPWTIRKVLLDAFPQLNNAKSQEEMDQGFLAYLQQRIHLLDEKNQLIQIQKILKAPNPNGHGHGVVYLLVLESFSTIKSIQNTCMFEAYPNQQNFHTLEVNNKKVINFVTSHDAPLYFFQSGTNYLLWIGGILGILLVGGLVQRYFK
ncbi:DUF6702 family protein [Aureispira anguillae]|uniref:Uncharacterized protein n=1 Tax=Aureispira anguillae TaxID=2864201 RepID=A0A916DW03_9BACT|nr:DUF6702 family protein [Aureispira anguillae]BDS14946.1 hypothetical protein AsAng_0057280 [Aureispira anguillae]